jgi:hypothetical protein
LNYFTSDIALDTIAFDGHQEDSYSKLLQHMIEWMNDSTKGPSGDDLISPMWKFRHYIRHVTVNGYSSLRKTATFAIFAKCTEECKRILHDRETPLAEERKLGLLTMSLIIGEDKYRHSDTTESNHRQFAALKTYYTILQLLDEEESNEDDY